MAGFDELSEALRDLSDALKENTAALRDVGGASGPGEADTSVGSKGGGKTRDAIGLGDVGKTLARAGNLGAGFAIGNEAAAAAAAGGDAFVSAQLQAARIASNIPILGAPFAQFASEADQIRSALAPLRSLQQAGVEVSEQSIRDISRIAATRAQRGREFDRRADPIIKEESLESLGEATNALVAAVNSQTEKVLLKLDALIQATERRVMGGGPR